MAVQSREPQTSLIAADEATIFADLQANIVKAHVRDHLCVLLLRFGRRAEARTFLKHVAGHMKSAAAHLAEVKAFKETGVAGTPYVGLGLTARGYAALGHADEAPDDPAFRRGMRAPTTRQLLTDPPLSAWEDAYRSPPLHAILLIGDKTTRAVAQRRAAIEAHRPESVTIRGEEKGRGYQNRNGDGIEHFGYVDGRSQPLFLDEDVAHEQATTDGATIWPRRFPLTQVLVPDPAAPGHYGTYLVFRKLKQDVGLFEEEEERFAEALGLIDEEDRERAGAMLVGRFEDGTPLTVQSDAGTHHPVINDFTYANDAEGRKCPHYAHIRRVNPRDPETRRHVMVRRGQTYGVRGSDDVGLLFIAFNSDIQEQFEYTQRRLANGVDQVIGQGDRSPLTSPTSWGGADTTTTDPVLQAVTMKGGEYFFMPSLAFLHDL
jgi:Dyp-type peroxidase family